MRVERGDVINPDSIRPQVAAELAHQGAAAAMSDQVDRVFREGVSAQFGDQIRLLERQAGRGSDAVGAVGEEPARQGAPVELDDDFTRISA